MVCNQQNGKRLRLVDNIPSVYARGSGVSIGNIRELNSVVNTDTITVKTEIDHDLGIGDPIEVQGASSRTANGKYVVIATPSNTEFSLQSICGSEFDGKYKNCIHNNYSRIIFLWI